MDAFTQQVIDDLNDVSREISRVNRAAGETIFNPSATQALRALIEQLEDGAVSVSNFAKED